MPGLIIVTTASRTWPEPHNSVITGALNECMLEAQSRGGTLTVRVGDARGGDRVIYAWAMAAYRRGWPVALPQRFEAYWKAPCVPGRCKPGHRRVDARGESCPLQGFIRNELMVDTAPKPDFCLAFIHSGSHGATQAATYAERSGVEVQLFKL